MMKTHVLAGIFLTLAIVGLVGCSSGDSDAAPIESNVATPVEGASIPQTPSDSGQVAPGKEDVPSAIAEEGTPGNEMPADAK